MRLDVLLADLKRDEGERLSAYDDETGKPLLRGNVLVGKLTIGIGRNLSDNGITRDEAEYLARNDIAEAIRACRRIFLGWDAFSHARQEALANMAVNMGETRLRKFKKMLAAVESGDWAKASAEAMDSDYGRKLEGRAKRVAAALLNG